MQNELDTCLLIIWEPSFVSEEYIKAFGRYLSCVLVGERSDKEKEPKLGTQVSRALESGWVHEKAQTSVENTDGRTRNPHKL